MACTTCFSLEFSESGGVVLEGNVTVINCGCINCTVDGRNVRLALFCKLTSTGFSTIGLYFVRLEESADLALTGVGVSKIVSTTVGTSKTTGVFKVCLLRSSPALMPMPPSTAASN